MSKLPRAISGQAETTFTIATLYLLWGEFPRRICALVLEWAWLHRMERLDLGTGSGRRATRED